MPKTKCAYCRGYTFDDNRGHCIACGAPRDEVVEKPVLMPPWPAIPWTGSIPQDHCQPRPYVYIGDNTTIGTNTGTYTFAGDMMYFGNNHDLVFSDISLQGRTVT